jgi:hypothetical protein
VSKKGKKSSANDVAQVNPENVAMSDPNPESSGDKKHYLKLVEVVVGRHEQRRDFLLQG